MNTYAVLLLAVAGLIVYFPASVFLPRWIFYGLSVILGGAALYVGLQSVSDAYHLLAPHVFLIMATVGLVFGGWLLCWVVSYKNTATGDKLLIQGLTSLLLVAISGVTFVSTVLYMFFTKVPPF